MSPKDRKLTVMLSETEYSLFRTVATREGHKTVSAFVRAVEDVNVICGITCKIARFSPVSRRNNLWKGV